MRTWTLLGFVALISLAGVTDAGEYNTVMEIGNPAPAWQGLIGTDDKMHSLSDLENQEIVVVVFTCNSCPYAIDAEERLKSLHEKYHGRKVAVVAINVNTIEADQMPAMKEKSDAKGFEFPYLYDETQQIAKDYGANVTPEFFVLDRERKVAYMGSIDDSPNGKSVTKKHVESAIDALLAGEKPVVTETVPIGCRVRWERKRRTRKPAK
ncbi:MAG: thioredoxin family protein [Rubripirellula sp.]